MSLADWVPGWGELEQSLNHNANRVNHLLATSHTDASLGWNGGWSGFSQQVSDGFDNLYNRLGGRRADCMRQALAESYPMAAEDLIRRFNGINIKEIAPVLLDLTRQMVMIMGGSIAAGAALGAAVGSLAFGAGAVPGSVVGAGVGGEVGTLILTALGLSAVAEYFIKNVGPCGDTLKNGILTAWRAPEASASPGTDPTGDAAAREQGQIHKAAWQLAQGQEQLVVLLLSAIVAYLGARGGVRGAQSLLERNAKLQSEIRNKEFAAWLGRNQERLLAERGLREHNNPKIQTTEPPLQNNPHPINRRSTMVSEEKPIVEQVSRRSYLNNKFDRSGDLNSDIHARANRQIANDFFKSQGYAQDDIDRYLTGLDMRQPVTIQTIAKGKTLWQWHAPGARGNWYSFDPTVEPTFLGINPAGINRTTGMYESKVLGAFKTVEKNQILRSTSAPVIDTWSIPDIPFSAEGGARQIFTNSRSSFNKLTENAQ